MYNFQGPSLPNVSENYKIRGLQQEIRDYQTIVKQSDLKIANLNRIIEELDTKARNSQRYAEEMHGRVNELNRRLEDSNLRRRDGERLLSETRQRLWDCEQKLITSDDSQWVVTREQIQTQGPILGRGAWGTVSVAAYRETQVACKQIHSIIGSRHNVQMFRREMTMASMLRHPNLVQFIGATIEGDLLILTELMQTSLRKQLQFDEYFPPLIVKSISTDVARALNYLHQKEPNPCVHRDISSANVLLEEVARPKVWKAKIADYGSVNILRHIKTTNPGNPVYAAPEASDPHRHSPKMDIYSLGALMLEMITGVLPLREDRAVLLSQVHHKQLLGLIERCLKENIEDRPNAIVIIHELGSVSFS